MDPTTDEVRCCTRTQVVLIGGKLACAPLLIPAHISRISVIQIPSAPQPDTVYNSLYITPSILHPLYYTLYITPSILHPLYYTLYNITPTLYITPSILHPLYYTLYITPSIILHPPSILHPLYYTFYITPSILHPL